MSKMLKFKIEKKEILYSLSGVILLLMWFLWIKNLISPYLEHIFPFFAMLIFDVGLMAGLFLMSFMLNSTKIKLKVSFIVFLILMGTDIIAAPYMVSSNGVINTNPEMWFTSSDVGWASLYQTFIPNVSIPIDINFLNIHLIFNTIWTMTYIITSILLMFVIPIIVGNPKIIKKALT
jgi:hypothetical protein